MHLVSGSGLGGHTASSQGRSHARDEACEERLCEKHSPHFQTGKTCRVSLAVPLLLDLRLFSQEEMADPFEGPANVLFEAVDDDDKVTT